MASRAVEGEKGGGDAEEEGKGAETGRTDTNKRDKRWRVNGKDGGGSAGVRRGNGARLKEDLATRWEENSKSVNKPALSPDGPSAAINTTDTET